MVVQLIKLGKLRRRRLKSWPAGEKHRLRCKLSLHRLTKKSNFSLLVMADTSLVVGGLAAISSTIFIFSSLGNSPGISPRFSSDETSSSMLSLGHLVVFQQEHHLFVGHGLPL
jgi:hypothetical protein